MKEYILVARKTAEKLYAGEMGPPQKNTHQELASKGSKKKMVGGSDELLKSVHKVIKLLKAKKGRRRTRKQINKDLTAKPVVSRTDPLPLPQTFYDSASKSENPSLEHLLHLSISPANVKIAKAFINLFDKHENIQWNNTGRLIKPIARFNIIDVIRNLVQLKTRISMEDIPFYKLILEMTDIQPSMIKNVKARKQIFDDNDGWISYR